MTYGHGRAQSVSGSNPRGQVAGWWTALDSYGRRRPVIEVYRQTQPTCHRSIQTDPADLSLKYTDRPSWPLTGGWDSCRNNQKLSFASAIVELGPSLLFFNRTNCPADVAVRVLRQIIYYCQGCLEWSSFYSCQTFSPKGNHCLL